MRRSLQHKLLRAFKDDLCAAGIAVLTSRVTRVDAQSVRAPRSSAHVGRDDEPAEHSERKMSVKERSDAMQRNHCSPRIGNTIITCSREHWKRIRGFNVLRFRHLFRPHSPNLFSVINP